MISVGVSNNIVSIGSRHTRTTNISAASHSTSTIAPTKTMLRLSRRFRVRTPGVQQHFTRQHVQP